MEEVGGEVITAESKTVNEFEGKLIVAEKEVQMLRLREKIAKEKPLQSEDVADATGEPEVKSSPIVVEREAEKILPKECWEVVLCNLDVKDLLSCRQVCKIFKQLLDLKEFKAKWKFPPVLTLLFPHLKSSDPDDDAWKHLYNARLVCRSWRNWIDKYASEGYGTGKKHFLPINTAMPLVTRFESLGDVEKFQETFAECKGNPFPAKSVYIGGPDQEPVEVGDFPHYFDRRKRLEGAYNEMVGKLLEQFGKHIFRLELCFTDQMHGPDNLTLCILVKGISAHLPSLKDFFIYSEPNEEDEEVASYIAENALGALPKLKALNICGLDKIVSDYFLAAFGAQLTQFGTSFATNLPTQVQMQELKNLRKLWLPLFEPKDTLESLLFLQAPLELLELTCLIGLSKEIYGPPLETLNMDKLLRDLNHLPIEVLEIHLLIWGRMNLTQAGIPREKYNNKSIKTLVIRIDRYDPTEDHQISFNFLQALTKLENLKFKFSREQIRATHPGEVPEAVELNEYLFGEKGTDKICHSNVWEQVPSLKTLTVVREEDEDDFTCEKYHRVIAEEDGPERN